jgi:hypothetical protein
MHSVGIEADARVAKRQSKKKISRFIKHTGQFARCLPRAIRIESVTVPTKADVFGNVEARQRRNRLVCKRQLEYATADAS